MPKSKGFFERYIEAAERTGDIMLSYFFQKEAIRQQLFSSQEREQLVNDITERVLSRISVTVDASEIFDAIDGLNEKIESLGR